MVCPVCGFPNDPSNATCARCASALTSAPSSALTSASASATDFEPPAGFRASPPPFGTPEQSVLGAPEHPQRSRVGLLAGIAVAVILLALGGAGYVALTRHRAPVAGPAATPAPSNTTTTGSSGPTTAATRDDSPHDQAAVLDVVLDQSVRSRAKLNQSIDRVLRCTQLSAAVSDMRAAGDERRTQLQTVDTAALDRLSNGDQLRSTLHDALSYALAADQGYLAWATPTPAQGCADTAARSAAFGRGETASAKAGVAKTSFLKAWNPVAADLGLPTRTRNDI
jgi:hypothetical protein